MRALITGGAGFIGSHLSEYLLKKGHRVDVVDDLSTGSLDNLKGCLGKEEFCFINDSVLNEITMHTLISRCDLVYHLAAAVGVQLIVSQPVRTIETNIRGTEVVLNIGRKFGKRVLIASTSEVYGKNENTTFREDHDSVLGATTFSRWSYACSKAIDEFLGLAYHRQFGLPILIVRLFNTIGERQTGQYGMVVPRFVKSALSGQPLTVYGDGKQSRCFSYVGDVIEAMTMLAGDPTAYGEVYNIGSAEEITIEDLAVLVMEITGSSSEIIHIPYEEAYGQGFDDMRRRRPDLTKIRSKIGFLPQTGLRRTLEIIVDDLKRKAGMKQGAPGASQGRGDPLNRQGC